MEYRINLSNRALLDMEILYSHIEADASRQAKAWFDNLTEALYSLGRLPKRCAPAPENGTLRQLLYGKKPHVYRIIYAVDETDRTVTVLHIRHGARDTL